LHKNSQHKILNKKKRLILKLCQYKMNEKEAR